METNTASLKSPSNPPPQPQRQHQTPLNSPTSSTLPMLRNLLALPKKMRQRAPARSAAQNHPRIPEQLFPQIPTRRRIDAGELSQPGGNPREQQRGYLYLPGSPALDRSTFLRADERVRAEETGSGAPTTTSARGERGGERFAEALTRC